MIGNVCGEECGEEETNKEVSFVRRKVSPLLETNRKNELVRENE